MSLSDIKSKIGEYGKDIRLNLTSVISDSVQGISYEQALQIALASAYATKNKTVIDGVLGEAEGKLEENHIEAAKAAATVMGMNNIYYRFVHMVSDDEYGKMQAGLRMQIIGKPGVEKIDFELTSLAVSAINGCGMCIDAHVAQATKAGVTKQGVQSTIKIASVINAAAQAVAIEELSS
jgi:alkyl hydroperoxide reductase subunit D